MTNLELTALILCCIYIVIAIATFIGVNRLAIEPEYRKFYVHPVMQVFNSMKNDPNFGPCSTIVLTIFYTIIYLPITCEWFIAWCIWKVIKLIRAEREVATAMEEQPTTSVVKENEISAVDEIVEQLEQVETAEYEQMPEDLQ
jgi:hypothetical protein